MGLQFQGLAVRDCFFAGDSSESSGVSRPLAWMAGMLPYRIYGSHADPRPKLGVRIFVQWTRTVSSGSTIYSLPEFSHSHVIKLSHALDHTHAKITPH